MNESNVHEILRKLRHAVERSGEDALALAKQHSAKQWKLQVQRNISAAKDLLQQLEDECKLGELENEQSQSPQAPSGTQDSQSTNSQTSENGTEPQDAGTGSGNASSEDGSGGAGAGTDAATKLKEKLAAKNKS